MSKVSFHTDGFAATFAAFEEFPKKFQTKAVKGALKAGMKNVILPEALKRVPQRPGGGALRKSLRVRVAKGRNGKRLPRNVLGYEIVSIPIKGVSAWYYAPWVELGTKKRRTRTGANRGIIEGVRFLRGALYDNSMRWRTHVISKLRRSFPQIQREVYEKTRHIPDPKRKAA